MISIFTHKKGDRLMSVTFSTTNPRALLDAFKKRVNHEEQKGKVTTWEENSLGNVSNSFSAALSTAKAAKSDNVDGVYKNYCANRHHSIESAKPHCRKSSDKGNTGSASKSSLSVVFQQHHAV